MNDQEKQKALLDTVEALFASLPKGTVTAGPTANATQEKFFFTLVGMAQWAIAHMSESRYEYLSPEKVKSIILRMDITQSDGPGVLNGISQTSTSA